jgi:hypothetical protein
MKEIIKNLVALVSLGALIFLAYYVFFKSDTGITLDSDTQSQAKLEDQKFLAKLKELQGLHIDTTIFNDAEFSSLVDHSVQVIDEDAGRPNPFEPVKGLVLKGKTVK